MTDQFETVLLDRVRVGVRTHIDMGFVRDNTSVDAAADHLTGQMVFELRSCVLAEKLPPEEITRSEEVPASWWQHFKADHGRRLWLRWLVRRRPVRTETLSLTVFLRRYWAYPEARSLPVDRFGGPVRIHTLSDYIDWEATDG